MKLLASLSVVLVASLVPAQSPVPGFNVTLDPDGRTRSWFVSTWHGAPALFVVGRAGPFVQFSAPSIVPLGTRSVDLRVLAWGVLDTRTCAPDSRAGVQPVQLCTTASTGYCVGSPDFLFSDTVPASGLLWPGALPSPDAVLGWQPPFSPFSPVLGPTRYQLSYCSRQGCASDCSRGPLYTVYSEPELMVAVFAVQ